MQIAEAVDTDKVAIIGGGKSVAFAMESSAHAFTIWSDTLYSNKKLAVCREIICNATDAHIDADKMDLPIEITLKNGTLSIRDFGKGIPDDKIGEIYCTYFKSTKQLDDAATGGFGLGSKAPFSYSDHFTVVSHHAGFKTIYALHKSDDANSGAPGCTSMMTLPSSETGVEVIVPIAEADINQFHEIVCEVVQEGGILANLNGERLKTEDYTLLRHYGYGISSLDSEDPVRVLFGNVLYDVPDIRSISSEIAEIAEFVNFGSLILYAPPSSVVPTPSRESLSMTPKTVATLLGVLRRMVFEVKRIRSTVFKDVLRRSLGQYRRDDYVKFLNRRGFDAIPGKPDHLFGPEGVAWFQAGRRVRHEDYSFSELFYANRKLGRPDLILSVVSNHPSPRVRATPSEVFAKSWALEDDQRQFRQRQVMKLISKAGLFDRLHYKSEAYGEVQLLRAQRQLKRRSKESKYQFEIRCQRSNRVQKIALNSLSLYLAEYKSHLESSTGRGFLVTTRGLDKTTLDKIDHYAEAYGIRLIKVDPPAKPEKTPTQRRLALKPGHPDFVGPIENKDLFRVFALPHKNGDRMPSRSVDKADFYLEPKKFVGEGRHSYREDDAESFMKQMKQYMPGTCAVLIDLDDEAKIKKENTPRIETLFMEQVRQRIANKKLRKIDRLALVMLNLGTEKLCSVTHARNVRYNDYAYKSIGFFNRLTSTLHPEIVLEIIAPFFKKKVELKEAQDFWGFVDLLIVNPVFHTTEEHAKEHKVLVKEVQSAIDTYIAEYMMMHVGWLEKLGNDWSMFMDMVSVPYDYRHRTEKDKSPVWDHFYMLMQAHQQWIVSNRKKENANA